MITKKRERGKKNKKQIKKQVNERIEERAKWLRRMGKMFSEINSRIDCNPLLKK
jgi:hypothetical protein